MNSWFPTQAINELAQEFKLLRKDIQTMRTSLEKIEQKLVGVPPTNQPLNQSPTPPSSNLFKLNYEK